MLVIRRYASSGAARHGDEIEASYGQTFERLGSEFLVLRAWGVHLFTYSPAVFRHLLILRWKDEVDVSCERSYAGLHSWRTTCIHRHRSCQLGVSRYTPSNYISPTHGGLVLVFIFHSSNTSGYPAKARCFYGTWYADAPLSIRNGPGGAGSLHKIVMAKWNK